MTVPLKVVDLHKRYGDHAVLRGISLEARNGDVISVIGSSGSGKSTLLRCINLLERPHAGTIEVDGEPLALTMAKDGMLRARDVSNRVLFLHEGEIAEQGDPREVLVQPRSERLQRFLKRPM